MKKLTRLTFFNVTFTYIKKQMFPGEKYISNHYAYK